MPFVRIDTFEARHAAAARAAFGEAIYVPSSAGLASTILRFAFARHHLNAIAVAFLTALLSGLVTEFAVRTAPSVSPVFCLTAAGMILVSGVRLSTACATS